MEEIISNVVTLSITFEAQYDRAFEYLADPMNQKEWAVHFIKDIEKKGDIFMATLPFGQLPIRIESDHSLGVLDFYLGEGKPTSTRLIKVGEGLCTYNFTLTKPQEMPEVVWENQGLPNMREELEILKLKLQRL